MAKKPTPQAPQQAPQTERYDVYVVENFSSQGEDRSSWTRVGVAFPHDDGKGFQVQLKALPVDGKLVIRLHVPKPQAE
jgi:hypothetical protein